MPFPLLLPQSGYNVVTVRYPKLRANTAVAGVYVFGRRAGGVHIRGELSRLEPA